MITEKMRLFGRRVAAAYEQIRAEGFCGPFASVALGPCELCEVKRLIKDGRLAELVD
jgi:hypothetical protein